MARQLNPRNLGAPNKQWYQIFPERYREEVQRMHATHPHFTLHHTEGENIYWTGEARAIRPDGSVLKSLSIKIECLPDFPRSFPRVYETGGVLTQEVCPHLTKISGDVFTLCYGTRLEGLDFEKQHRVEDVVNYSGVFAARQWYYERYGYWPDGHAHDTWPFIEREIKEETIDPSAPCPCGLTSKTYNDCHLPYARYTLEEADHILKKAEGIPKRPERNDKCPCQSNKKFKKCCFYKINHAHSITFLLLKYPGNYSLSEEQRNALLKKIMGDPNVKQPPK